MLPACNTLIDSELISAFNGPKTRTACPVCRSMDKDSTGDHLQIGEQRIHCHADPEHSKGLYGDLMALERGNRSHIPLRPAPDYSMDPHSAFFDDAYDEKGDKKEVTPDSLRCEAEVFMAAADADLSDDNVEKVLPILNRARFKYFQKVKEAFEYAYTVGLLLKWVYGRIEPRTWAKWCEENSFQVDQALRFRTLADCPWSEIEGLSSMTKALEYIRSKRGNGRRKGQSKGEVGEVLLMAKEKEIQDRNEQIEKMKAEHDEQIEKMKAEDPGTDTQKDIIEQKDRKIEVLEGLVKDKTKIITSMDYQLRQKDVEIERLTEENERLHELHGKGLDSDSEVEKRTIDNTKYSAAIGN